MNVVPIIQLFSKRAKTAAPVVSPPVLLITPPSAFLLDERVFISLGILKVAAVLERAGVKVELLDLSGIDNFIDVMELHIIQTSARVVGFTVTTPQLPAVSKLARRIREIRPELRLIVGGPHVTLTHAAVKLEQKAGRQARAHRALAQLEELFDVIVSGDGEDSIFYAIADNPPKLIDADEPKLGLFMTNEDYDASPYPARHLVDIDSYRYTIEGHKSVSLIGQLGCPFKCGFCGGRNSKSLRKIRVRTSQSVINEVEMLHKEHGFTGFMFYDDELNVNKSLVELMNGISELQSRLGVEFRLRGFVKSELFNDEQAAAMYRAGFRWVLCGFEGANPRILTNIEKQATLEDNTRVMSISKRHNLKVKALMSVGHPGESPETITDVHDWLLQVKPDDFDCTVITTYPGTPYYDEALEHETLPATWTFTSKRTGDRLHAVDVDFTQTAEYYKGDPNGGYHSYVFTDFISADDLVKMRDWVEKDVREKLNIPFNPGAAAVRYEHSMGQNGGDLPPFVLRTSK